MKLGGGRRREGRGCGLGRAWFLIRLEAAARSNFKAPAGTCPAPAFAGPGPMTLSLFRESAPPFLHSFRVSSGDLMYSMQTSASLSPTSAVYLSAQILTVQSLPPVAR